MTSAEARDILWSFQQNFLDGLTGAYYVNLKEAIKILYEESYYADPDNTKEECNPTCGCSL